jgi:hypothetical protein
VGAIINGHVAIDDGIVERHRLMTFWVARQHLQIGGHDPGLAGPGRAVQDHDLAFAIHGHRAQ